MGIEIKHKDSGDVLFSTDKSSLQGADLQKASLQGADLRWANLQGANLQKAILQGADLQGADLQKASLQGADLRWANLQKASLQGANLQGANLDFSAWEFSCKTIGAKVGDRLVAQLFFHWARLDVSGCSPHIRYMHGFTVGLFNKTMANWFCKYRDDVKKI